MSVLNYFHFSGWWERRVWTLSPLSCALTFASATVTPGLRPASLRWPDPDFQGRPLVLRKDRTVCRSSWHRMICIGCGRSLISQLVILCCGRYNHYSNSWHYRALLMTEDLHMSFYLILSDLWARCLPHFLVRKLKHKRYLDRDDVDSRLQRSDITPVRRAPVCAVKPQVAQLVPASRSLPLMWFLSVVASCAGSAPRRLLTWGHACSDLSGSFSLRPGPWLSADSLHLSLQSCHWLGSSRSLWIQYCFMNHIWHQ